MIVRRLASRRLVRNGSTEEEPRRKRAARFLVLIIGCGIFAGVAAALGIWPFGTFQSMYAQVVPVTASQISGSSIFPAAQPVHKTVDVYASPRPVYSSQPAPPPEHESSGSTGEPGESGDAGHDD